MWRQPAADTQEAIVQAPEQEQQPQQEATRKAQQEAE
jgi:hypothetical protein